MFRPLALLRRPDQVSYYAGPLGWAAVLALFALEIRSAVRLRERKIISGFIFDVRLAFYIAKLMAMITASAVLRDPVLTAAVLVLDAISITNLILEQIVIRRHDGTSKHQRKEKKHDH